MVLFKRKPVRIPPLAKDPEDDAMVWQINETGEVFTTYDDYLERMDFYKGFNCEISGRSGLTYFEALKSEAAGAQEVEQMFPEALKGPVLRMVQFKTTSRLDNLVDMVFDEFKDDFFPGETVLLLTAGSDRPHGVIRDKVTHRRDGVPHSQYMVSVSDPAEDRVCEAATLLRDRKSFNKTVLRSFIKKTVTRDAWNGAPWLVRHNYANRYHIETRVPMELSYDTKLQERKLLQAQKRASIHDDGDVNGSGSGSPYAQMPARLPDLKPEAKSHKKQHQQTPDSGKQGYSVRGALGGGGSKYTTAGGHHGHHVPGQFMHLPLPGNPFETQMSIRNGQRGGGGGRGGGHAGGEGGGPVLMPMSDSVPALTPPPQQQAPPPSALPPPKYPIEDLLVPRRRNPMVRPRISFLCRDAPGGDEAPRTTQADPYSDRISMQSVGPLLETWDTLNVYCEIFKLDSFTFDDYVEAMCVASDEVPVELFDEIHCSVLKVIVDEAGRVQVPLPALEDDSDSSSSSGGSDGEEEAEDQDQDQDDEQDGAPGSKPARATRGSLAKQEAQRIAAEAAAADAEASIVHRADEVLEGRDWVAETARREFGDGGWEMIVVGLLRRISRGGDGRRAACDAVLAQLVPASVAHPTVATVRERYARLGVDMRVQALQIVCMLTYETRAFRAYMEECSEGMTQYRKDRIEWQRRRKAALEEVRLIQEKKHELEAADTDAKPEGDSKDGDVKMADADDDAPADDAAAVDVNDDDSEEDAAGSRRGKRRPDKPAEKTRREKDVQERREREKAAAAAAAQAARAAGNKAKQLAKLARDVQRLEEEIKKCEDEVGVIENDLRESDCPRTRVLGKDRFWNRYYWFERNGMPFGGLPSSSTAEADYACGRIWVQGPDDLERQGFIEVTPEAEDEYRARFGDMTVVERKAEEEGGTSVSTAREWGFISEPAQLDALMQWLDHRGHNEMKLKKELTIYKDRIVKTMRNRRRYLGLPEEEEAKEEAGEAKESADGKDNKEGSADAEEAAPVANGKGRKRSRHSKAAPPLASSPEPSASAAAAAAPAYRCTRWTNLTAIEECGHLHSRQPPPAPGRKKGATGRKREAQGEQESEPARKTRRR